MFLYVRSLQMWGSQDRSLPFSIPTFVCFVTWVTSHIVHKSQNDDISMFWYLQRESLRLLLQRGGHGASWEQRILYARRVGTGVGGRVTGVLSLVPVLWRIFISQTHLNFAINWSNSYRKLITRWFWWSQTRLCWYQFRLIWRLSWDGTEST